MTTTPAVGRRGQNRAANMAMGQMSVEMLEPKQSPSADAFAALLGSEHKKVAECCHCGRRPDEPLLGRRRRPPHEPQVSRSHAMPDEAKGDATLCH
jgi:hypothetical protein